MPTMPNAVRSIVADGTGDFWIREDAHQWRCITFRDPDFGDLYAHADSFEETWGVSAVIHHGDTIIVPVRERPEQ